MLSGLHVKNLALIEEEEINFTEGLNILTGETGAGKSMVIGSCLAALGARADRSMIRDGAEYALIEMTLRADTKSQEEVLSGLGLSPEEDGTILIKRRIYPGKTVCQVCGETVTLKECAAVGAAFINVYGQRDHFTLLNRDNQRKALDQFSEEAPVILEDMGNAWKKLQMLRRELEEVQQDSSARTREMDILDYEISEIEEANIRIGEDEELEAEFRRLSSMEKISRALLQADALTGEDGGACEQIGRAVRELSQLSGLDDGLDRVIAGLSDAEGLMRDFRRDLEDYMENAVPDEAALNAVTQRLDLINRLKDKYGPSLEKVLTTLGSLKDRQDALVHSEERLKTIRAELEVSEEEALQTAKKLSGIRKQAAKAFSASMETSLKNLNFPAVVFEARIDSGREYLGPDGMDRTAFYISLNPGEPVHPLEQTASGGELSRIMLAMKTVIAGTDEGYTFVFDEIDSGISGQTAWKVAQELGRLSGSRQILCITHLPQIAAMADTHFEIFKTSEMTEDRARTRTQVRRLDEDRSEKELARLLGGTDTAEGSEAALLNAREIRHQAKEFKERIRQ